MENQEQNMKMMVLDMDPVVLFATAGFLLEMGACKATSTEFSRQAILQVCAINDIRQSDAMDLTQLGQREIQFMVPTTYVLDLAVEFATAADKSKKGDNMHSALSVLVRHWLIPMEKALAMEKGEDGPDRTFASMN